MTELVSRSVFQTLCRMRHMPAGPLRTVRISRLGAATLHHEMTALRLIDVRLPVFLAKGRHRIRHEGVVLTAIWPL